MFTKSLLTYWVPIYAVIIGGGMWLLSAFAFISWAALQFIMLSLFTDAYEALDTEMKKDDGTGTSTTDRDLSLRTALEGVVIRE